MSYSPMFNRIKREIKKLWPILNTGSSSLALPSFAIKRRRNLRDSLVHTMREPSKNESENTIWGANKPMGHTPCGGCSMCAQTTRSKSIEIGWHTPWQQRSFTNCKSKGVIYLITCPCTLRYVGMTTREVKTRLIEHKSCIRTKKLTAPLVNHFVKKGHKQEDFTWTILEKLTPPRRGGDFGKMLLKREQLWIFRLNTEKNGLNEEIQWNSLALMK